MICKLFKYDFRAIGTKLFPLYVAAILTAIFNRIAVFERIIKPSYNDNFAELSDSIWLETLLGFSYIIGWLIIAAIFIVTFFVLIGHYYRSVYGEEGYLTNTLPITPNKIILSKLLTYFVWNLIGALVAIIAISITHFDTDFFSEAIRGIKLLWEEIFPYMNAIRWFTVIVFVLTFIMSQISGVFTLFLSSGIGHQFKHKLAMGVCAYMGISFVISTITQLIITYSTLSLFENYDVPQSMIDIQVLTMLSILLITITIITIILFYALSYFHTKKLNLE